MSKKMIELINIIRNKELVDNDFFDDSLITEIINLQDISIFHLVLNYIEKINSYYSSHIMDQKTKKYKLLMESFDMDSNLFSRDKNLIIGIKNYIERVKLNESILDAKYSEIETTFKTSLTDYSRIQSIIADSLGSGKSFESLMNSLKDGNLLSNNDFEIIKDFYSRYKEYYELDSKLYSDEQDNEFSLISFINENYPEEIRSVIRKSINTKKMDSIQETLCSYNTGFIRNIIISSFFEEVPENFIKNLNNIVSFQREIDQTFIEPEMLKIYQTILNSFSEENPKELINLYKQMSQSNVDYKSKFYDNFIDARKVESKMLIDSVYKVDKNEEDYGLIDGVKYYVLMGQPFYMIIHGSMQQITDFQSGSHDGISMSFISGDRLNVYNDGVIYGFDTLNPEQFIELYTRDTATEFDIGKGQKSMLEVVPYYYTPEQFIKNTPVSQYNEILYLSGRKENGDLIPPKPSYIVCMDDINKESIEVAKKLQIPIVKIYTEYYPKIQKNNMGHFAFLDEQDVYKAL